MPRSIASNNAPVQDQTYSLKALGLLDAPEEKDFDAITTLAKSMFDVSVALISIIDEEHHRQFFKSQIGLREPWASKRETPLTHSFCQYVRQFGEALIVNDSKTHDLVRDNLAIQDLGVASYLGAPIYSPEGEPIGALCVIDDQPREWSTVEVQWLNKLARCVSNEVRLKAAKMTADRLLDDLSRKHEDIDYDRVGVLFGHNLTNEHTERSYEVSGTLSSFLISGENQFHFRDVTQSNALGWRDFLGNSPACFAGIPIVLEGQMFGTLELSSSVPRPLDWTEEELSLLSMMSMLACVYLGMVGAV